MAIAKQIILHIITAPVFVLGYLYVGLMFILFMGHRLEVDTSTMIVHGYWRPWLMRATGNRMPSFTLGVGFMLNTAEHIPHERVHVRQYQDVSAQGFAISTIAAPVLLDPWVLLVWPALTVTMLVFYFTAWLRGATDMLREPEHEASAYAQTRD